MKLASLFLAAALALPFTAFAADKPDAKGTVELFIHRATTGIGYETVIDGEAAKVLFDLIWSDLTEVPHDGGVWHNKTGKGILCGYYTKGKTKPKYACSIEVDRDGILF